MHGLPILDAAPDETRTRGGRGTRVHRGLLDAELFASLLSKECKRVDRSSSGELFLLLSIDAGSDARSNPSLFFDAVADAVLANTRQSDIIGWIRPGISLGVILPGWSVADAAMSRCPENRIRNVLAARFGKASLRTVSMRFRAYPESRVAATSLSPLEEDFWEKPETRPSRDVVKRSTDVVLSLLFLLASLPLYLVIALVVKLTSPGPVLFRQSRVGQEARPFTMLKFRTMRAASDPTLHREYVTQFIKGQKEVSNQALFKLVDDPRVTPIGRFLRRTSLDELPQFWNVLVGDMSLVGPRPPLPYEFEQYEPWHRRRVFEAKPGVTGLWQVVGRSRTTFDQMVRLDLRYARTRSFWTDLRILLATPRAIVSGNGAA
jgi:lipopolysaccharide/colanic/teichoic acid biosynthesis glycosyltransferase